MERRETREKLVSQADLGWQDEKERLGNLVYQVSQEFLAKRD